MRHSKFHAPLHFAGVLLVVILWSVAAPAMGGKDKSPAYTYTALGNPSASSNAKPVVDAQSIVLMGGGYDVGEAFRWMINRAGVTSTSGGHFLVLSATGSDAYNPYIYSDAGGVDTTTPKLYEMVGGKTMGLSSSATLIIPNRTAANDPRVNSIIGTASAIFIAGGDQADYYNHWHGTGVETALRSALAKNIPIGGTSSGAEIMGQFAFVALNGSVTSSQALGDPFNPYMTINPLNTTNYTESMLTPHSLEATITDVHVNTRDRLGRSIAFMARLGIACGGPVNDIRTLTIALDEETALLISGSTVVHLAVNPYNAENFTSGRYTPANSAYFVRATTAPSVCKSRAPLRYQSAGVRVTRWSAYAAADPAPNTSYIAAYNSTSTVYGVEKGSITHSNNIPAPY